MRDKKTTVTILVGKIRLKGALAGKEEPLHSWVPRSVTTGQTATATSQLGSESILFQLRL